MNTVIKETHIATILESHTFQIGENSSIMVVVDLYSYKDKYYITSWLNGCEECNTEEYTGNINDPTEILSTMENLVRNNESYITDIANWNEE